MDKDSGSSCPFCGTLAAAIFVQGHTQCSMCRQVIETCCEGDSISRSAELATLSPVAEIREGEML